MDTEILAAYTWLVFEESSVYLSVLRTAQLHIGQDHRHLRLLSARSFWVWLNEGWFYFNVLSFSVFDLSLNFTEAWMSDTRVSMTPIGVPVMAPEQRLILVGASNLVIRSLLSLIEAPISETGHPINFIQLPMSDTDLKQKVIFSAAGPKSPVWRSDPPESR